MTDETKKLFDAPWEVCLEKRGSFYRPCVVSSDTKIASVCTKENANRIAHLPELYDALQTVAYENCHMCLYRHVERVSEMPSPDDMAKTGCQISDYPHCPNKTWWELLRKVRDGE